jgi:hypothetical protein
MPQMQWYEWIGATLIIGGAVSGYLALGWLFVLYLTRWC